MKKTDEYIDFCDNNTNKGADFIQSIQYLAPEHCTNVMGDFTVAFKAPNMTHAEAFCWQQPTASKPSEWGHDVKLFDGDITHQDLISFKVPADEFPNGPMTIRIQTTNEEGLKDYSELQLFNLGGVIWNQGIPKADPPGAAGMKLVFEDDFDEMPSISVDGMGARYSAHKTSGGDFSGWQFSDPRGENDPFGHVGTFLRIHASKLPDAKGRSGILASLRPDGTGVCVSIPSYFECRFVAQSAPGTWPAFWTLTKSSIGMDVNDPNYKPVKELPLDEIDIIEAYGGYGPGNPNHGRQYSSVGHFWRQPKPNWCEKELADGTPNPDFKQTSFRNSIGDIGGKSSWSWTFHTYAAAITETDTIYYFDNIEVARHPTGKISKAEPAWFLINYAIAGISGWPIDMERYGNKTDMWIDYVRVYSGA